TRLLQASEAKALHMLEKDYWSHADPGSSITPWFFLDEAHYAYYYAGENLAKDFTSSEELLEGWLNSPSHRQNLLDSRYSHIGVAVVEGDFQGTHTTLVVQM